MGLSGFFNLPDRLMTALATVLGFALLDDLNADQQNSLGNFLMLIGQVLETNAGQKSLLQDIQSNKELEQLKATVADLEARVAALSPTEKVEKNAKKP